MTGVTGAHGSTPFKKKGSAADLRLPDSTGDPGAPVPRP